ncbi:hypothetical protein F5148DRAFT_447353 [Russula earlei]|uniref:Uncharacterized protein n=1 Tax=Russula earlei TaxID=71964 RepID=A0ACC0TYS9_9AGAM|nr:hypothetical protein F5148DRAFT_447353 [Russula earlei]
MVFNHETRLYDCSDMREERPPDVADPSGPAISYKGWITTSQLYHISQQSIGVLVPCGCCSNRVRIPMCGTTTARHRCTRHWMRRTPFPLWNCMRLLLIHGADVSAQKKDGSTSLHLALSRGLSNAALVPLRYGSNFHVRNEQGQTSLHLASRWKTTGLLLMSGADVNVWGEDRWTPPYSKVT